MKHLEREFDPMNESLNSDTLTRRDILQRAALGGVALAAGGASRLLAAEEKQPLRVIAYNVYNCTGWPKDRVLAKKATAAGQMPDRFAMELALYEPDIINFSESPDEAVVKQIAKRLGMNYVRFPSGGNWPGTLLSRYEIVEPKNVPLVEGERPKDLFTRHWGQATVKLPGGEPLIVHSAHLHPSQEPEIRLREIPLMLASMKADLEAGRSMLLIGDLNHVPDCDEYRLWIDAGWIDTFAKAGKGDGLTIKADEPQWRIDYVMAASPIAKRLVESRPLFEGAFRTNPADEESFALSDHLPQLAVFE
jgi:endonuclease/exonuclease/phosphatase family metal-dependent hydrolase